MSKNQRKNRTQQGSKGSSVGELIARDKFNPFTHRTKETGLSKSAKYFFNFLIACLQTVLNIPILVVGLVSCFKDSLPAWVPSIEWMPTWSIAWLLLGCLLIIRLYKQTEKNIVSEVVNFIWAVNYYGPMKNFAYSIEIAEEKRKDADSFLNKQSQQKIQEIEAEYDLFKEKVEKELERVQKSMDFPAEFFDAIVRMVDLITNVIRNPDQARYEKSVLLDKLLAEVCASSSLPGAHQASIMCPDANGDLRIVGSVNIKESVVLNRVVKKGEQFVGKVYEASQGIWITDLRSPEVTEFGFDPTKNYPYKSIVGIPIKSTGPYGSERIGVISVHFRDPVDFKESEQSNIRKLLEVIGHFVVYILTHDTYHNKNKDVILELRRMNGGERDVAVAQEEVRISQ